MFDIFNFGKYFRKVEFRNKFREYNYDFFIFYFFGTIMIYYFNI